MVYYELHFDNHIINESSIYLMNTFKWYQSNTKLASNFYSFNTSLDETEANIVEQTWQAWRKQ